MNTKKFLLLAPVALMLWAQSNICAAYPILSGFAGSTGGKVQFFNDNRDSSKFWYMPTVVAPVANLDGSVSKPVISEGKYLYFAFSGQPRADQQQIRAFAAAKGVPMSAIAPVYYESTDNVSCFNLDDSKVNIQFPSRIGSFSEMVPVSIFTRDPEMIEATRHYCLHRR